MSKTLRSTCVVSVAFLALGATKCFALLGGCADSPEDPTAVMAILGGVAAAIPLMASRLRSRSRKQ
jgi:XrtJ-associated TM-motif-TM protein